MTEVECTSTVTAVPDEQLTAHSVAVWSAALPGDAVLTQIIRDRGTQRDPWPVLVGLKATWKETR